MIERATRFVQTGPAHGSLRWIRRAVEERWPELERPILRTLRGAAAIDWCSPLRADDHAEYRDAGFLARLGLDHLAPALADFWPAGGPQWDALAVTDGGHVLLVEAKAHVREFLTAGTSAGPVSRARIDASLRRVAAALGSAKGMVWADTLYQYSNRLAHLWFLREADVDARLVLVGFIGDAEMRGPSAPETWRAAYQVADHALGLSARHPLARYVVHVHPTVRP